MIRRAYAKGFFKAGGTTAKKPIVTTDRKDASSRVDTPQSLEQLEGAFPIEAVAGLGEEFGYLTDPDTGGVFFSIPPE